MNLRTLFVVLFSCFFLVACKKQRQELPVLKLDSKLQREEKIKKLYDRGWMAGSSGKYDLAIRYFREVLKIDPQHFTAIHDIGLAYSKKGEIRLGIEWFQKAIAVKPDYAEAWFNLSTSYFQEKQNDLAYEALQRCLEAEPEHSNGLLRKATLLEKQGALRESMQVLSHYLNNNPTDMVSYAKLGSLYFQQGLDESAKSALMKAVNKVKTPTVYYQLGVIHHRQGELAIAREFYNKVIEKAPNHVDCLVSLGEILEIEGDYRNALVHYEKAYGLEPDNTYIRAKIDKIRRR